MFRQPLRIVFIAICFLWAWFLGYIRFPYFELNAHLALGLFLGACLGLLISIVWYAHVAKPKAQTPISPSELQEAKTKPPTLFYKNAFYAAIPAVLALAAFAVIALRNYREKLDQCRGGHDTLKAAAMGLSQSKHLQLLTELIKTLDSIYLHNRDEKEVAMWKNRIVALSSEGQLYKAWNGRIPSSDELSAVRRTLLLAMLHSGLDSASLQQMLQNISFAGTDLRQANLQGFDLSHIDLQNANLEHANLVRTNLDQANLKGANLQSAILDSASLIGANLVSANLTWAQLNAANLKSARLDSAVLSNASLQGASLHSATFIGSKLRNALLTETDLSNAYVFRADLSQANLNKSLLHKTYFLHSSTNNLQLSYCIADEKWLLNAKEHDQNFVRYVSANYDFIADSTFRKDSVVHRLKPKLD